MHLNRVKDLKLLNAITAPGCNRRVHHPWWVSLIYRGQSDCVVFLQYVVVRQEPSFVGIQPHTLYQLLITWLC